MAVIPGNSNFMGKHKEFSLWFKLFCKLFNSVEQREYDNLIIYNMWIFKIYENSSTEASKEKLKYAVLGFLCPAWGTVITVKGRLW